jgi:hypothetical protein
MMKAVLTIWYALAVLHGPGVCCCSWVTPKAHALPQKAPAPKRAKSCCSAHAPTTCETTPAGMPPANDPPKCPCKPHKKAVDSTPGSVISAEVAASHRLAEWVAVVLAPDLSTLDPSRTAASPCHVHPLGGRALLSAYHLLRC